MNFFPGNIHVMSNSLGQVQHLAINTTLNHDTQQSIVKQWLANISLLLASGRKIANCILQGRSVMVHCSDGWDRTPQVAALAQLMLDPYYRTIIGFQVLLEKEFCDYGHPFGKRYDTLCQHKKANGTHERSPILQQFIGIRWPKRKEKFRKKLFLI